jgi:hypothetical protein
VFSSNLVGHGSLSILLVQGPLQGHQSGDLLRLWLWWAGQDNVHGVPERSVSPNLGFSLAVYRR